jgi:uncharacterized membrane protein
MKMHKYFMAAMLVLLVQLILVLIIGYSLPADAKVPTHWNIQNQIDGWSSRNNAILPFWLFNLGLFLLLFFSGKLSPVFQQNKERYDVMMPLLAFGLTLFFALIHIYTLLLAGNQKLFAGFDVIYILIGGLFIFIGNVLPRMPRNFIAGIRTPWTIYSDEIWRRTSRLGGWCFFALGLAMLVRGFIRIMAPWYNVFMVVLLIGLVVTPLVYSFILYMKSKKEA